MRLSLSAMMLGVQRRVDPSHSLGSVVQQLMVKSTAERVKGVSTIQRGVVLLQQRGMGAESTGHVGRNPTTAASSMLGSGLGASYTGEGREGSAVLSDASEIAVLDMGEYFSGEAGAREGFVESLRDQCHRVGLFYVKNHGVSQELCEKMLAGARRFFDLPTNSEMDYTASPQFRGYMKIGVENTAGLVDFREQIEFGPEENADTSSDENGGDDAIYPVFRRLRGPNQWPPPAYVPEFRGTAMEFMEQMNVFSMHLMQALALSLGLDHDFFDSTFLHSPHYQMKVARYPSKPAEDGNAEVGPVLGVGPHSDTGFLSLLLQDNVGGLQAQTVDGVWIDVPPVEGTLVVNLGEMLQLATHGYYLATVHRVLSLPGTNMSRYSVPFFFNPRLDAEAKPMDVETITSKEWRDTSTATRAGGESTHGGKNKLHPVFGINTFKSFARSHPQVVKRHHPDLTDGQGNLVLDRILES